MDNFRVAAATPCSRFASESVIRTLHTPATVMAPATRTLHKELEGPADSQWYAVEIAAKLLFRQIVSIAGQGARRIHSEEGC